MAAVVPMLNTILTSINTVMTSINVVSTLGRENQRLQGEIEGSLGQLKRVVEMTEWDMEKYEGADENLTFLMQELLCDIDDFTSDLSIPEKTTAFFNSLRAKDSRPEEIKLIESYLASIESIRQRQKSISEAGNDALPSAAAAAASTPRYAPEKDLDDGFPATVSGFMELLSPAHGGQLRLISIVGCSGLGKTALARAVYEAAAVRIHGANETTLVPPTSPPTAEIHELVEASEATPIRPSPPTAEVDEPVAFNCKAWVEASTCKDAGDLLNKVLTEVDPTAGGGNTSDALKRFLHHKRYLVIIDNLRSCGVQWKDIKHAFPTNDKANRIIVTTNVHSIAADYSSGSYYVYPLQCIGEANSQALFWTKVFGSRSHRIASVPEIKCSRKIVDKCDGLPVALNSAGNYLCWKERNPHLSDARYKEVCEELHNIAASDESAFGDMKRMFTQCYNDMTGYDQKNCLLYLSIFPRGHQINSKSFLRRLKGEALVTGDALKCLKRLIDKSMIKPSLTRNSCNVAKRCQVQGMMLEFTIHKSLSRNLVTLVVKGKVRHNKHERHDPRQKKVRRLIIQSGSSNEEGSSSSVQSGSSRNDLIPDRIGLSAVRSLTIFKSKLLPNSRVNFKSCKMVRVLDLEGCEGLSTCIGDICELPFLNYLSLRNTDLEELPTEMKNLTRLETLDIRQTRVAILPVEVIMLPELSHLFGEFELPQLDDRETKNLLTEFLKEKSRLHTLAGIVIKKMGGFKVVIEHARELKKVKICGDKHSNAPAASVTTTTPPAAAPRRTFQFGAFFTKLKKNKHSSHPRSPTSSGSTADLPLPSTHLVADKRTAGVLVSSLQKRFMDLESISIDSSVFSKAFLASDQKPHSVINSIKLRGPLTSISGLSLKNLGNLKKLHLFSTGLSSQKLVEALQILDCLQYLKLAEEDHPRSWEGDFSVQSGGFPALRELCFEGPKKYPRLKIAQEAMIILASLHLLCPLTGVEATTENHLMRVEGIEHLIYLDEVILHHTADDTTVHAWKEVAKKHTNRPCVKKQPAQPTRNAT